VSDPATTRRELGAAVLLVLAGAVLLLVSTAGAWVTGVQSRPSPLPSTPIEVGSDEAAGPLRALALVVLASVPALAATRRAGRTALGVLLVIVAVLAGVLAARVLNDPGLVVDLDVDDVATTSRPVLAVAGAVLTAVAGAVVAARGRHWAALSRRYERPAAGGPAAPGAEAAPAPGPPELWDALDRGEDPTRG
jgi:uncharacterized membrane protein (TIGR02234 family)